jgi:hypothetical protein
MLPLFLPSIQIAESKATQHAAPETNSSVHQYNMVQPFATPLNRVDAAAAAAAAAAAVTA